MPLLRNPYGKIVCVSEDERLRLLAESPIKFMKGGKLAESRGFRDATENELKALREIEKAAEVEHKREGHERSLRSKKFTSDLIDGIKSLAGAGTKTKKEKEE